MHRAATGARARQRSLGAAIALWTSMSAANAWAQPAPGAAEPIVGVEASSGTVREILSPAAGTDSFSLRFENAPPQDVLNAFIAQAKAQGITVQSSDKVDGGPVTLVVERQPFWVALQSVTRQLRLAASDTAPDSPPGTLPNRIVMLRRIPTPRAGAVAPTIATPSLVRAPSLVSGPFLIAANRVSRSESVLFSADAANAPEPVRQASIDFNIWLDPRVRLLTSNATLELQTAEDEAGRSLLPRVKMPAIGNLRVLDFLGTTLFSDTGATMRLQAPVEMTGARRIARLKGTLRATIITRSHLWRLPDAGSAANAALTIVGPDSVGTITLTRFEPEGTEYRAELTLQHMDVGPRPQSQPAPTTREQTREQLMARQERQRNNPLRNALSRNLRLVDAGGGEWRVAQLSYKNQGDLLTAQIRFARRTDVRRNSPLQAATPQNGPLVLTLEVPTATRELVAPFEFSDLPLP